MKSFREWVKILRWLRSYQKARWYLRSSWKEFRSPPKSHQSLRKSSPRGSCQNPCESRHLQPLLYFQTPVRAPRPRNSNNRIVWGLCRIFKYTAIFRRGFSARSWPLRPWFPCSQRQGCYSQPEKSQKKAMPDPRKVYEAPSSYLEFLTSGSDDKFESQNFERKEVGRNNVDVTSSQLNKVRRGIIKTVSAFAKGMHHC